jgi:hypothetical protein
MLKFDIAGIVLEVNSDKLNITSKLRAFICNSKKNTDIRVKLKSSKQVKFPEGKVLLDETIRWVKEIPYNNKISACFCIGDSDGIEINVEANDEWNEATVTYLESEYDDEYMIRELPCEIVFRNRILLHEGIVIHASAVEYEGKGIIFTAPSGTGKSTQASLWKEHMGSKTLNDDHPALRIVNSKPYVYGTPWSGSSPEALNGSAPLRAIFVLEQATQNSIQLLDKKESVSRLMARCFLPYFECDLMNIAMRNLEKVINSTPVFLMKCRPDKEAVDMVYQYLK